MLDIEYANPLTARRDAILEALRDKPMSYSAVEALKEELAEIEVAIQETGE